MKNRWIIIILISSGIFTGSCRKTAKEMNDCENYTCWENLIRLHLQKYPALEVEDLYKLLYQSTLGSGHAIADSMEVVEWLNRDLAEIDQSPEQPVIDTLGSCGRFARIHLRGYIKTGGKPERLIMAFIKTGMQYPADSDAFFCALASAKKMAERGDLPWESQFLNKFLSAQAKSHYPAVHHSEKFNNTYRLHYRVIAIELLPELLDVKSEIISRLNADALVFINPRESFKNQSKNDIAHN